MLSALFKHRISFFLLIALFVCGATTASAQTTEFSYQGTLNDNSIPANANYDFEFRLFAVSTGGTQIGGRVRLNVPVTNGGFTVQLDFLPAAFNGTDRFLEISVKPAGSPNPFTTLSPRQPITYAPYSFHSLSAETADAAATANTATDATQLGGVAASQYVLTGDSRLSDARNPLPGSDSYIQSRLTQQPGIISFNISGNGTLGGTLSANAVSATTQYNLAGFRVLSISGTDNTFVGRATGTNNNGADNSFFGHNSGHANTVGFNNSFFGSDAGLANTDGSDNSSFGYQAGSGNTTGERNSFFGSGSGSLFGVPGATGSDNSFFGWTAGALNQTGSSNTFIGAQVGWLCIFSCDGNTTGSGNTFIGAFAGQFHNSGDLNTLIGFGSYVDSSNVNHATAIGAGAAVSSSNTIVLGRSFGEDTVVVPGKLQIETLGTTGNDHLCINSSQRVALCSSSLRYKTNLALYRNGLDIVNRLSPITFTWKDGGMRDLGFGAEDVEKIEPLLVTYNKLGQVEGVKYDRINVVLINAVKEQQAQIAEQQKEIKQQQERIGQQQRQVDGLRKLVCLDHPDAAVCKNEN